MKNPPKKIPSSKAGAKPARGRTTPAARKTARKSRKKPRAWTGWIIPAVSLVVIVYAVIRVLGYYLDEQRRALHGPIEAHPATARAKVLESTGRKSKQVHYEFLYKGIVYEKWQSDYDGNFRVHRCYDVRLDSTNPMRSYLLERTEGACE